MTREEITDIARSAGVDPSDKLQAFAFAVAEAQRERSARLVWKRRSEWMRHADWQRCEDACAVMASIEMEVRNA